MVNIASLFVSFISLLASAITIKAYVELKNNKSKFHFAIKSFIAFISLFIATNFIFSYQLDENTKEIESIFFERDAKFISKINEAYTLTYAGSLDKLNSIIGFLDRHKSLFGEESKRLKDLYNLYYGKYERDYIQKKGIIFPNDTDEINDIVKVEINKINEILNLKK